MAYARRGVKGRTITVYNNDINRAISALKHMIAPMMKELREKQYYEKPSDKKRRKQKESRRKVARANRLKRMEW
jgi:small subunit ribosomal protein S21